MGAIRPAKFAKYLCRFGWKLYILTIKEEYIPAKDHARLADVSDLPIFRTTVWPTVLDCALRFRRRLSPFFTRRKTLQPRSLDARRHELEMNSQPPNTLSTRLKAYLNSIFELPDRQIGWLLPAVWKAYSLVKREGINAVITSSPPRTTALVGLCLSLLLDIKLITDLRDPWFLPVGRPHDSRSWLGDKIETWLEKMIMRRSSKVITTTEQYETFLRRFYSWLPADRFHNIWNGYDAEDFRSITPTKSNRRVTFSYLGSFYFARTPKKFLRALGELIAAGDIPDHEVRVNFIGHVHYAKGELVEDLVSAYRLVDCVKLHDAMPYEDSLRQMLASDVLLLFAQDQYYNLPTKTFEYLAAKKRILCFARDGATAELIRRTGAGLVVDPDNVGAIKIALQKIFRECRDGKNGTVSCDISLYERRGLAVKLSRLLERSLT